MLLQTSAVLLVRSNADHKLASLISLVGVSSAHPLSSPPHLRVCAAPHAGTQSPKSRPLSPRPHSYPAMVASTVVVVLVALALATASSSP